MSGINKVFLLGNLGSDPDIRYTRAGNQIANLSMATGKKFKDKDTGEWTERTEWHRVVLFGQLAEFAGEYLKKGARIHIEGELRTRKWQDQEGNDRYTTNIIAQQVLMLNKRENQDSGTEDANTASHESQSEQQEEFIDDDIPF